MPLSLDRTTGIPADGIHLVKVTKSKEQLSQSSGNPQWVVEMTIQDQSEDKGKIVTVFMALEGTGRFVTDAFLDAIAAPRHGSMTAEQIIGKLLRIGTKHDSFNGAEKAAVSAWLPATEVRGATPPPPVRNATMTGTDKPKGLPQDVKGTQQKPAL